MAFLSSRNGITVLALITGVIHLAIGIGTSDPLLLLNGVGYLVLLYATFWTPGFLKGQASLIRWAFIGYTLLTIVMYFVMWGADAFRQPMALFVKLVEVLLVVGLWQSKK